jgi:8-oxo-dGTP pyrophosphatase MutT (NUDIX family)
MLDLDPARDGPTPIDAATLVLVRDGASGLELFCVERNRQSRFLGGAIVFPGGRVEESDRHDSWADVVNDTSGALRVFAIAACRETLEEAALLVVDGSASDEDVVALRTKSTVHGSAAGGTSHAKFDDGALRSFLRERHLQLDLRSLVPLARWITPKVESRRFDARFFVARAPQGQRGAHDMSETMASFWESPTVILARFDRSEIQLAPPTHRTLMQLAPCATVAEVMTLARSASLEPICPELVPQGDTMALTLPGDPEHSVRATRVAGPSRYVLRGSHWRAENAP